jgi:hypothetical protein
LHTWLIFGMVICYNWYGLQSAVGATLSVPGSIKLAL